MLFHPHSLPQGLNSIFDLDVYKRVSSFVGQCVTICTPIFLRCLHKLFTMASVDDILDAFPEDREPESPPAETPPVNAGNPPTSPEDDDSCLLAVKAAMETIGEFCGMEGFPVTLAGITVRVPTAVLRIAQMKVELPRKDRIDAIRESTWMMDLSSGLCTEIRGFTAGTPEHDKCAATLGERMADELVK